MADKIIASFPQWGNYAYAFKYLIEQGFDTEYLVPPPITKKTLELGSYHSPDFVCVPFKYCLGGYIEALESGANCLMQINGACRLNYFGELSEQILHDLGYEFKFFNMANINVWSPKSIIKNLKIINPELSIPKVVKVIPTFCKIIRIIDKFEDYIRQNVGFEVNEGEFDKIYSEFLDRLSKAKSKKIVKSLYKLYKCKLSAVAVKKPENLLKVGVIGDYYTVQEPFSNHFIEKELAKMGMEILRCMNLTNTLVHSKYKKDRKTGKKYAKFDTGATSNYTLAEAIQFAERGVDGIIHIKASGCTPEIDIMPILQNISEDYKIPVLFFSFDSQTGEAGVKTRLEAFYDMVIAKKELRNKND